LKRVVPPNSTVSPSTETMKTHPLDPLPLIGRGNFIEIVPRRWITGIDN